MDGPLSLDAAAVRAAVAAASDQDVVRTFVKLAIQADLSDQETEVLRNEAEANSLLLGQRQFGDAAVGRLAGYLYTSTSRQAIRL